MAAEKYVAVEHISHAYPAKDGGVERDVLTPGDSLVVGHFTEEDLDRLLTSGSIERA